MRKILTVLLALCFSNSATYAQEFNAKGVVLTDANASIAVLGLTVEQTVAWKSSIRPAWLWVWLRA